VILKPVEILNVSVWLGDTQVSVGRLAQVRGQIYFEYDIDFLSRGIELSPFKLPLKSGVQVCSDRMFEGLFGVFNDSLPDGWGRLLLDRAVQGRGVSHQSLTPLDRLAHVGSEAMGALEYKPDYSIGGVSKDKLNLLAIEDEISKVIKGEPSQVIEKLMALGGSSAGARPKILVGFSHENNEIIHGIKDLPGGYEPWMIKFASVLDQPDIARIEYAYSLMAKAAGVEVPPTKLFEEQGKKAFFGVRRFDRVLNQKIHMHSVAGMLHADHRIPSLDYENIMRCTMMLTRDVKEVERVFRLAIFNVYAHNRDDHSKNFSFLMDAQGNWRFAPAYDITFSYGPGGEHSSMVMGEGRNPGSKDLMKLGEKFQVKDIKEKIAMVRNIVSEWPKYAEIAQVTKESKSLIKNRLSQIG
jgi:serine/threonine-protein kinase HipA